MVDHSRWGLRLLIDGPDLSGKTTLAQRLKEELEERGWKVVAAKGRINPGATPGLLTKFNPNNHPDSALLNAAYIANALFDWFRLRDAPAGTIFITEGYVDRSIAYGLARRLSWVARLAARASRLFPGFDLAILVTADRPTRTMRMSLRRRPSRIDSRAIESHYRFLAAYRVLFRRHANRVAIDTSKVCVESAVEIALQQVLSCPGYRSIALSMRATQVVSDQIFLPIEGPDG
ncbi:hypothetical protein [Bradyrhizobium sp. SZCCHNS2017]|uniref:dTMP kinase n=1 Tax=Bradyrhizobium sp. SZCCHNS2017 TaxID=3057306 RepID=UPI002916A2CC|nr:hypothetical protein [Bradyrhizobium sp. SZCCHNS2017]